MRALWLAIILVMLQSAVATLLFFLETPYLHLLLLLIPISLFIPLLARVIHRLKADSEAHLLAAAQLNSELNQLRLNVNKDPLTGLHSRGYIRERLDELLAVAVKREKQCALLYLDIDFFKDFNDALGHTMGNQLLVRVADRLKSVVKQGDILGYQGGDEFIIVLPEIHDMMAAELVARRIISSMANQFELHSHKLTVSTSIGITIGPSDGSDSETLIRRAESALITTKSRGRKGYSFYSHQLNSAAVERLQMDQLLRGALERNEFYLVYQPIVSLVNRKLKGFEVLLRWQNNQIGQVSPADFIPVAEQIGIISEIGNWVIRESIEQLKLWNSLYDQPIVLSINVSPRQFQDESLLPTLKSALSQTGVQPNAIQLEVTEGLFLSASDRILNTIDLLKKYGIRLALDDFGTGFSSLSYLNRLPFDVLKIDKSFVDHMVHNDRDSKMVLAILLLARSLKLETVVEGVESAEQIHHLREFNADYVQGYYYSKPLKAREAQTRFLEGNLEELNETIWDRL